MTRYRYSTEKLSDDHDGVRRLHSFLSKPRKDRKEQVRAIAEILQNTRYTSLLNEAAIALSDFTPDAPEASALTEKAIEKVLKRVHSRGLRGTLLYVLDELDITIPLGILVDVILDDGYEAQQEALNLIEKSADHYRNTDKTKLIRKLRLARKALDKDTEWRRATKEAILLLQREANPEKK